MSDALTVISPKSIDEAKSLATTLAPAAMLPEALRQKPADVLAVVLTGAELGLAPMQSIRGIKLIKGTPTLSADTMAGLVKARRDVCSYLRCVETTDKRCEMETLRRGDPEPTSLSYTMDQAQRAGLALNDNYRKHPEAMLRARATSAICRLVYPDVVAGLLDPEELDSTPEERDVTPPAETKPPSRVEQVRAQLEAQKAKRAAATVEAPRPTPAAAPKLDVVDVDEAGEPTPYELLKRLLARHGMSGRAASDYVKTTTGKARVEDFTLDDVELVKAKLDDESGLIAEAEVAPA